MKYLKYLFVTLIYLTVVLIQPVPAPVPRCSPLIIINKLAESSNVLSDSNPYFPVPPCEYGGWVEALQEGDLQSVLVLAEPQKIPLHNFYEFIWLLKTGGPRMLRMLTGQEKYIFDRDILREGYHHHTPYVRTKQLGQYTHRNPIIIDDKNTYKTIVGGKIKSLFTEGKDKEINKHYTYQGGRIGGGKGKGKGKGHGHSGHGHGHGGHGHGHGHSSGHGSQQHSSGYGAPQSTSGYGAPQSTSGYGAPQSSSGYGAPATGSGYGTPSTGSGYGTPSTGSGYGAPSTGSGYGAPSTGSGYGAPSTGSGYGAPSTGSGYGAPQTNNGYNAPAISTGYSASSSSHHGSNLKRKVSSQEAAASSVIITANNGQTASTYDAVPVPAPENNPFLRKKKHIKASDYDIAPETRSILSLVEDHSFVPSSWPLGESQRQSASKHGLTTYFNSIVDSRSDQKSHEPHHNQIQGSRNLATKAKNIDQKPTLISGRARGPYFLAQRSGQVDLKDQRLKESKNLFQRISDFLG
ncbi:hypothetical protein TCAL_13141 [Tigriopus californicus]|uniref:Uncharacterized protein n=1 Tax=Tigriopus californicus TaxID=6832 RepID=A0A553PS69_TIGCA|nr:hornerin-like [Tigriopus californicus]XP_059098115.1 hornerin-like [Tigriopus californicus]XP_059098116.1 hornerin-like [Tigriopus californicus]TRY80534.1 hypothetical protein TCAL_13141 [Tigriopus californicus]|eukprot:TCALIF_13141-PA protein Name:"Similar to spt5 Transcription elongation factor spt5 (Schizosaccharomyces pombe (strain 972 / ATCC 24843))" AED:0.15 eAED:0.15 QI:88/1/0.8/1/1/1/5/0/519